MAIPFSYTVHDFARFRQLTLSTKCSYRQIPQSERVWLTWLAELLASSIRQRLKKLEGTRRRGLLSGLHP